MSPAPSRRAKALRLSAAAVATGLLGVAFQLGVFSVQAARQVVFPARSLHDRTPAQVGLPYEAVAFPSRDGLMLTGWFVKGGPATVVLTHGHGGNKGQLLDTAEFLHQAGYSLLLFDFRASGESEGNQSTLGYHEAKDIAGALDFLGQRPEVDAARVGALGISMGAAALLLTGDDGRRFAAIVADSAFSDGESLVGRLDRWFNLPRWPFSFTVPLAVQYYSGLAPRDVAPLVRVVDLAPTPLLVIHGELDPGIPAADARAIFAAAAPPKELWVVDGAGHGQAFSTARGEYVNRVLTFFERTLR